jgi:hypothetical protein
MKPNPFTTCLLIAYALSAANLSAAQYFIDAVAGSDNADGQSEATAWQSLDPINQYNFAPGDTIHLRAGQAFNGQIRPTVSGEPGAPIRLTAYGEGARPQIHGEGKYMATVRLENLSHWIIDGIEITNTGPQPKPNRQGIHILAKNAGTIRDITIRNCTIRDVNGSISKSKGGGGAIMWEVVAAEADSNFDGLLIQNCTILRTDRDGIKGRRSPWRSDSPLSTNVVVRGNVIKDIGGDGIVPIGTEGALIEYNRIYGARQRIDASTPKMNRYTAASAGIWPWSSNNTLIRFNEVWGYAGTFDGQAYDADYDCDGTVFEYNFSSDNAGGFFLICSDAKSERSGASIGNTNTVVRHNISLNDHLRGFVIAGPVRDVRIYENIVVNTIEEEFPLIVDTDWGRHAVSVDVRDNLFFTKGTARLYRGTGDGGGLGLKKYKAPINPATIRLSGNGYFNVASHSEPHQKVLPADATLGDLVQMVSDDPGVEANFDHLFEFLKASENWSTIEAAL